ncbi:MAG: YafY family transcriptional regulator [Hamadaea sp.]|nr:YafY family transcriptional regulator [Hamadaea sp.]
MSQPPPAARLLAMLELLQAHRHLTTADLAGRLSVDERTVRRYAGALAELGVPVEGMRGRYGGYRLLPGYKLPPLMLTDDEAVAVALGLVAAERIGLAAQAPATASALAKIQRVLPATLAERLSAVLAAIGLTLRRREPTGSAGDGEGVTSMLLTVGEATRGHRRVRLAYRSYRGESSRRDVDPYGLVFHAGHWYVPGHDHSSGELRTFRLDRVERLTLTAETFEPPAEFDAVAHVLAALSRVPYAWSVTVRLDTDMATARARLPVTIAQLETVDGAVLMRTRAERLDGMAQMLSGLGWPFTVVEPVELREAVAAHAARLAAYAARS